MGGEFWSWVGNTYLWLWDLYKTNREHIVPLLTFVGAIILAWAALRQARNSTEQARTAAQQADLARQRHEEQIKTDRERTDADRQRRITDSFAKAVEQLGSDKLQVRLGGIYTLERISRESELDYWPIMETLTAFVRERARWKGEDVALSQTVARLYQETAAQQATPSPPTDIAAVLTVIKRREERNREREKSEGWSLDLRSTDLRGADLREVHLEGANLTEAHLEGAFLRGVHLEGANLLMAHLEGASLLAAHLERVILGEAHLERANLTHAHLEEAKLLRAHLERADLMEAHLEEAILWQAHLEGADLRGTYLKGAHGQEDKGLKQDQLHQALGDAKTKLPEGLTRPAHWPQ